MTRTILGFFMLTTIAVAGTACNVGTEKDPEVTEGYGARLSEADIRADVSGKKLGASFVIQRTLGKNFSATLTVDVVKIGGDGKALSTGSTPFTLDSKSKTVKVALTCPEITSLGDLGGYVLRYRVQLPDGALYGQRSLFLAAYRSGLVVVGNNRFAAGEKGVLRVMVTDPSTGKGLAGKAVTIQFASDTTNKTRVLSAAKTGKLGELEATFTFSQAEKGAGIISVQSGSHKTSHSVVVEQKRQILLTTDKPLYQPGQSVHIRALAMKQPRVTPVAGEELLLEVEDSQGTKLFKKKTKTDSHGIASLRFDLARLVNLGKYTVRVSMGTTVRQKTFKVDKYALPKFKVKLIPFKSLFKPGEAITGKVQADYFFGKPVKGAKVTLTARRPYSKKPELEVHGTADAKGTYAFSLAVSQSADPVILEAAVEDLSGAKAKAGATVLVSGMETMLQLVADRHTVVNGDLVNIYVLLTDPVGKPRAGTVTVSGMVNKTVTIPASGLGSFQVSPKCGGGYYNNNLQASSGKSYRYLYLSCAYGANKDKAVRVTTDRALYKEGDTASVTVSAPAGVTVASVDVVRQNATVASHKVTLSGGSGVLKLKLTGDLRQTLEIKAHASAGNTILADQRLIFVQGADLLTVKVTTDKKQYRPAQQAKVSLQLLDNKGNPAPGAIGVQVVDEALYALTEVKPGMERKFFFLEQEVVNAGKKLRFVDPSALLKTKPTADDQIRALMLFASAGQKATFPINYQSDVKDRATALSASQAGIAKLADLLEKEYEDVHGQEYSLSEEEQKERLQWVESWLKGRWDDFGVSYKLDASYYYYVTVKSAGMDETWDTKDDISAHASIYLGGGYYGGHDASAMSDSGMASPDSGMAKGDAGAPKGDGSAAAPVIRQEFPETLYVNPALITDNQGKATIDLSLADSITTWRMTSIAHTLKGQLGSSVDGITVFQEFFVDTLLPAHLTQNDEVEVPVAVYNYTATAQTVTVSVKTETWFDLLSGSSQQVTVAAKSLGTAKFRIRAKKVGTFGFTATGISATDSDGLKRAVVVLPDGVRHEVVKSGELKPGTTTHTINVPKTAVEGATELFVRVFPGILAESMTGLESLFRKPYGCFEQTSSTTYPNVMVMQYLKTAGLSSPSVEKKALGYISAGYQRLLSYEVSGGGFSLWGKVPANIILTAFGLMEFSDMSKVRFVDPQLIARTQTWLVGKQQASGAFVPPTGKYYEIPGNVAKDTVRATAYVAWALHTSGYTGQAVANALAYVRANVSAADTYTQAVAANALLSHTPTDATGLSLLVKLKAAAAGGTGGTYWTSKGVSMTYGYGKSMTVETTALVVGALLLAKDKGPLTGQGLRWLAGAKGGYGGWGTTQATILAIRALLMSLAAKGNVKASGTITVSHNGAAASSATVTPATADVTRLFDLKQLVQTGDNKVQITFTGKGELAYQVVGIYYLPHGGSTNSGPLGFTVSYDKTSIKVNESIKVTAKVTNSGNGKIPTVMMRVGLPPGFDVDLTELSSAKTNQVVQKVEQKKPYVVLYLGNLGTSQTVTFEMKASLPVKAQAPPSDAYPYYTPEYDVVVDMPVVTVSGS